MYTGNSTTTENVVSTLPDALLPRRLEASFPIVDPPVEEDELGQRDESVTAKRPSAMHRAGALALGFWLLKILYTSVSVEPAGPAGVKMSIWANAWNAKITSTTARNIAWGRCSGKVMRKNRGSP